MYDVSEFSYFMVTTGPSTSCYYRSTEHYDQAEEFFENAMTQHPFAISHLIGFEGSADRNGTILRSYDPTENGDSDVAVFVRNAYPIEPDIYEAPREEQPVVKRGRGRPRKER